MNVSGAGISVNRPAPKSFGVGGRAAAMDLSEEQLKALPTDERRKIEEGIRKMVSGSGQEGALANASA